MNLATLITDATRKLTDAVAVARDLALELRRQNDARERAWAIHWYTDEEAAKRLGMTTETFRNWAAEHGIKPHQRQISARTSALCYWAEQVVELIAIARRESIARR